MPRLALLAALLLALACKGEDLLPAAPTMPAPPEDQPAVVLAAATFRDANDYRTRGTAILDACNPDRSLAWRSALS